MRVGEILRLFHSFYRNPADVDDLLEALRLEDKCSSYYGSLSGGLKQRLSIAPGSHRPTKIAVLDEMTTGLDAQARRDTWELIEQVRDRGIHGTARDALNGRGGTPLRPSCAVRPVP